MRSIGAGFIGVKRQKCGGLTRRVTIPGRVGQTSSNVPRKRSHHSASRARTRRHQGADAKVLSDTELDVYARSARLREAHPAQRTSNWSHQCTARIHAIGARLPASVVEWSAVGSAWYNPSICPICGSRGAHAASSSVPPRPPAPPRRARGRPLAPRRQPPRSRPSPPRAAASRGSTTTRCPISATCRRRCGSGCAFLDYDGDGWMDIYLVNSGPSDFFTPKTPLRNALYRNNRDGTFTDVTEKAGVPGGTVRHGRRRRRLRQRRLPRPVRHRLRQLHAVPQQRQRHLHRRHRQGRPARAGLDDERGVVRLRQRRPSRPVRLQLRRVLAEDQRVLRRQQARDAATTASRASSSRRPRSCSTTTATARSPTSPKAPTSSAPSARASASSPPISTRTVSSICSSPTTRCRTSCS